MDGDTDDVQSGEITGDRVEENIDKNMEKELLPDCPDSPMQQSPDQSNFNDSIRSPKSPEEHRMETPEEAGMIEDNDDVQQVEPDTGSKQVSGSIDTMPESPDVDMEQGITSPDDHEEESVDNKDIEEPIVSSNTVESSDNLDNLPVEETGNQVDDVAETFDDMATDMADESEAFGVSSENREDIVSAVNDENIDESGSEIKVTAEDAGEVDSQNVSCDIGENIKRIKSPEVSSIKSPDEGSPKSPEVSSIKSPDEGSPKSREVSSVKSPDESSPKSPEVSSVKSPDASSLKSPEVSSTSNCDLNSSEVPELSEDIDHVQQSVNDNVDFNYPASVVDINKINETVTKNILLAKWEKQRKNIDPMSDIDVLSTVTMKGSVYSVDLDDDVDKMDLDLSKPGDQYRRDSADKDRPQRSESIDSSVSNDMDKLRNDSELIGESVSNLPSVDNSPDKAVNDDDKTESSDGELDKSDDEEEKATEKGNEPDSDKKSEASLEEVSDDDDEEEEGIVNDDDDNNKDVNGSLEEVSSDEDETEMEKTEKKVESGMEEISDEEDMSENESEDGMENVSSDEDNDVNKPDSVTNDDNEDKIDETRTVEVKQNGETVTIDDTGKEDGVIVKEILENMTIKIENNTPEDNNEKHEVNEVSNKVRRKSKDKKEKKEMSKPRSKPTSTHVKDTRDISERLKAQANYGEDVELDYDDNVHDESKDRQASESEGEIMSDSSDAGEITEEEDCEEGEIREPGQKPYVKPTCRFFMRGHCTWGINCRFLHPGVNDKGYYQLIERPGFHNKPPPPFEEKWEEEEPERTPSPEPPPPPPEPKEETAWERGLRQAKELRKKALERREMETNFEHKKLNLSIEDNPEYDKENTMERKDKSPVKKTPYYDKYEPLSDDEYYDQTPIRLQQKQMEQSWLPGHYENFEVRWTRDHQRYGSPPPTHGPPGGGHTAGHYQQRYPYHHGSADRGRERFPLRPSPRRFSPSPPMQRQRYMRSPVRDPREMMRRDKMIADPRMNSPPSKRTLSPGRPKADEWNDPWRRSNANKGKSPPKRRSRSRGRRRSRRSFSYSSSYSSSSYSGSSRSRSSSFSSVSSRSRSSRSSSVSRSRSPAPRSGSRRGGRGQQGPPGGQPIRRPTSPPSRHNDPPRSSVSMRGRSGPDRRYEGRGSPMKPGRMSSPTKPPPGGRSAPGQMNDNRMKKPSGPKVLPSMQPPPQRKFQMAVKTRDRPLPQSALIKDKGKPMRARKRTGSSSSSRSSSSSSRSSISSRSSRSRSSSSSSSGSADSDHLYRNIGGRENQKSPAVGRGKPDVSKHSRQPSGPGRSGTKPTIGETSRPSSIAQTKIVKDPLQMKGLKSNIKLTLIKPNDKSSSGTSQDVPSRKRPPEPGQDVPPSKRPALSSIPKTDKTGKKLDKPVPISPTKPVSRQPGPGKHQAAGPASSAAPGAAAGAGPVKKKNTVSRREELLKQLQAVEHAIAKKKKKMT